MLPITTGDLFSINRNCLTATAGIIKDVAIVLMIYTLICLVLFNGIAIMTKNADMTIIAYALLTIIMLGIAIVMIYLNLN
jgi:hypothetical protein